VSEQRQRFIEDFLLNYYTVTELAERFGISRKTAYKWINRYKKQGQNGFKECSRRPHTCPWQTKPEIVKELIELRKKRPSWGLKKLLDVLEKREPERQYPSIPTVSRILSNNGLIKPRRRYRRALPLDKVGNLIYHI
jgi:putative transposase